MNLHYYIKSAFCCSETCMSLISKTMLESHLGVMTHFWTAICPIWLFYPDIASCHLQLSWDDHTNTPTANSLKGTRAICNAADPISGQKSCPLFAHDFIRFSMALHSVTANASRFYSCIIYCSMWPALLFLVSCASILLIPELSCVFFLFFFFPFLFFMCWMFLKPKAGNCSGCFKLYKQAGL